MNGYAWQTKIFIGWFIECALEETIVEIHQVER